MRTPLHGGNLGKEWNELDLVPYRLTTGVGNQADATTTYTFGITADREDAGHPGGDVLGAPVVLRTPWMTLPR